MGALVSIYVKIRAQLRRSSHLVTARSRGHSRKCRVANGQELTAQVCGMGLASAGSLQVFGPQALAVATKVHLIDFYSLELSDSLRDIDRHRSFVKYLVT